MPLYTEHRQLLLIVRTAQDRLQDGGGHRQGPARRQPISAATYRPTTAGGLLG